MKKYYYSLLALFLFSSVTLAQKDSLLQVIKTYKKNDLTQSQRILAYIELENDEKVWMNYNSNLLKWTTQKLQTKLSQKDIDAYKSILGQCYNNIGFYYNSKNQYNEGLKNLNIAAKLFEESKDIKNLGLALKNIGNIHDSKGDSKKALNYFNKVYQIRINTKDSLGLANVLADIARVYSDNGAETKALTYFRKALFISDKLKDEASSTRTNKFMAMIYLNQKEYGIAEKILKKNLNFYIKTDNKELIAETYHNLAFVYKNQKRYNLMNTFNDLSLKIALKEQITNYISMGYEVKCDYFLGLKKMDSARKYCDLYVKYATKSGEEPYYTKSVLKLSQILFQQKQYNEAKSTGITAFKQSQKIKYPFYLMQSAKNLKEIYAHENSKAKAFEYAEIEIKIKDSLNNINTKNSAIKSMFMYETEKKESQIKQLTQEKQISDLKSERKSLFLYSSLLGFSGILLSFYFFFRRFKTNKQNELLKEQLVASEAQKQANESELKALKSQMNPHFIFNALNSIQEQFMYGDKLIANEQMENFTTLTRQILSVSGKKKISLTTEIDILTRYLELEKMRFDSDFFYTLKINEDIDEEYIKIPPMLIQPFVENSIKHGLLHKQGVKKLDIIFQYDDTQNYLIAEIIDNGIGRKKSEEIKSNNKHNSFSTSSISQRLQLLNNNENADDILIYEDLIDAKEEVIGTKVILKINLDF